MSKFKIEKRLDLGFVGEEWSDCFLRFKDLTMSELQELTQLEAPDLKNKESVKAEYQKTVKFIQDHFIDGQGVDSDGNKVAITKDDISNLSASIIRRAMDFLAQG